MWPLRERIFCWAILILRQCYIQIDVQADIVDGQGGSNKVPKFADVIKGWPNSKCGLYGRELPRLYCGTATATNMTYHYPLMLSTRGKVHQGVIQTQFNLNTMVYQGDYPKQFKSMTFQSLEFCMRPRMRLHLNQFRLKIFARLHR